MRNILRRLLQQVLRQIRVPNGISPRERSDSVPPPVIPVFSSFAHTKSFAPQLLHVGGTIAPQGHDGKAPGLRVPSEFRCRSASQIPMYRVAVTAPMGLPPFARITVAIDGSKMGDLALDLAVDLARRYQSDLSVVAVAPLQPVFVSSAEPWVPTEVPEAETNYYRGIVDKAVKKAQTAGVSAVRGPAVTDPRYRYGLSVRNCQAKTKKERSCTLHVRGIALSGEEQTLASFHRNAFHILGRPYHRESA